MLEIFRVLGWFSGLFLNSLMNLLCSVVGRCVVLLF